MPAAKVTLSCNVVIGARPGVEAKASAQWWIFWYTRLHLGLIKVWVLEQRMATCSQKTKANFGICSSHGSLLFQKLAMNQSKCSCFKTVLTIYRSIYGLPWHWGTMLVPNWTHLWSVCTFWEPRRPVILNALRLALSYIACHFYVGSPGILYPFGPCRYYRHVWSCWHFATMWWFSLKHLDFPLQHTTWPPWIWGLYHLYHWPSTSQQKYHERCIACHLNHRNTFHFPIIIHLSNGLLIWGLLVCGALCWRGLGLAGHACWRPSYSQPWYQHWSPTSKQAECLWSSYRFRFFATLQKLTKNGVYK